MKKLVFYLQITIPLFSFCCYLSGQIILPLVFPVDFFVDASLRQSIHNDLEPFKEPVITTDLTYNFKPFNKEKCPCCNFTVRNQEFADSTENDLIIVAGVGQVRNLGPFMRTLRTTGSKCGVVLLTDDNTIIDPITEEIAINCGLQIYRCGIFEPPPLYYAPNAYVYYYIKAFLEKNIDKLHRVIVVDLFDTVFQGDPFNVQVNGEYINAIDEGLFYLSSWTNRQWYSHADWRKWPKVPLSKYLSLYLCSGYFGGNAKDLLKLITVFVNFYDYYSNAPDQGVFNYLFLAKGKEYGLKRSPFRWHELVHHTTHAAKNIRKKHHRVLGKIPARWNTKKYASVIHLYYKSEILTASILFACPRLPNQSYYIARLNENEINNLEKKYTPAILDD